MTDSVQASVPTFWVSPWRRSVRGTAVRDIAYSRKSRRNSVEIEFTQAELQLPRAELEQLYTVRLRAAGAELYTKFGHLRKEAA